MACEAAPRAACEAPPAGALVASQTTRAAATTAKEATKAEAAGGVATVELVVTENAAAYDGLPVVARRGPLRSQCEWIGSEVLISRLFVPACKRPALAFAALFPLLVALLLYRCAFVLSARLPNGGAFAGACDERAPRSIGLLTLFVSILAERQTHKLRSHCWPRCFCWHCLRDTESSSCADETGLPLVQLRGRRTMPAACCLRPNV